MERCEASLEQRMDLRAEGTYVYIHMYIHIHMYIYREWTSVLREPKPTGQG